MQYDIHDCATSENSCRHCDQWSWHQFCLRSCDSTRSAHRLALQRTKEACAQQGTHSVPHTVVTQTWLFGKTCSLCNNKRVVVATCAQDMFWHLKWHLSYPPTRKRLALFKFLVFCWILPQIVSSLWGEEVHHQGFDICGQSHLLTHLH